MDKIRLLIGRMCAVIILGLIAAVAVSAGTQAAERNVTVDMGKDEYEPEIVYTGDYGKIIPADTEGIYEAYLRNGTYTTPHGNYDTVKLITGWSFESDEPSVLQIDAEGNYKVLANGKTRIRITEKYYEGKYADVVSYCSIPVTPGSLEVNEPQGTMRYGTETNSYYINVYADASMAYPGNTEVTSYVYGQDAVIYMKNMPEIGEDYHFEYKSSNSSMNVSCDYYSGDKAVKISSYKKGSSTLTIVINNLTFNITYTSRNVSINRNELLISKKEKKTLKLKDYDKKVKWKSTNPSVAKVNKKGVVVGKKKGNAIIYADLDGYRLGCVVSVVTSGMKKVVKHARWIPKHCRYSQAKRMSKGYFDCSALVWKSYHKIGKNFGDKNYAPTAASMAQWCARNKKMIKGGVTYKRIEKMQLNPGDIVFYDGRNNGRYKGIYHVEMITGYVYGGWDGERFAVYPVGARLGIYSGLKYLARP